MSSLKLITPAIPHIVFSTAFRHTVRRDIIALQTKPYRQMLAIKKIFLRQKNLKYAGIPAFFFLDKFSF